MDEIYIFSQNTLSIDISDASNPTFDSDAPPVVNVVDIVSGTTIDTGTATAGLPGNYTYIIPFSLTTTERQLRIDWTYNVDSVPIVQSVFTNVVTPYLSMDFLRGISNLSKTDDDLKLLEQTVRTVINNYTAQSFGTSSQSLTLNVQPGYSVTLPQRAWLINSIFSQYDPTTDLYASGAWILTDPYTLTTQTHYMMGDIFYEDWLVTGPLQAPILYSDQQYFVPHSYYLTVNGNFGWQTIPADIIWAAKRLANTYLCNDDTYRVKQVQSVGSNTWTVAFNPNLVNSTGDLDVDRILDNFYIPRMGSI